MDIQVKDKWIEALRSGEYIQGKNKLHSQYGFCCLGVLCDIAEKEGLIAKVSYDSVGSDGGDFQYFLYGENTDEDFLPTEVREWSGLEDTNPTVLEAGSEIRLSQLNDNGESFEYIANLIEEQH